jgi:AcrR family transcriptional regulator
MPPKVRVTKEEIINAAFEIVRRSGPQALNARNVATALNCSTQPIFSNFASMEELQEAVGVAAYEMYLQFLNREVESGEYHYEDEVDNYSLPRTWKFEKLGKAKLIHDIEEGFILEGEYRGEKYRIQRKPLQINSLHVEYDYFRIRRADCIDISTENDSFYCYPSKQNVITKLAFATESIYQKSLREKRNKK